MTKDSEIKKIQTQSTEISSTSDFLQIVKWFLRYVLISGCRYSTDKNSLAYIGSYTFSSVEKALKKLDQPVYIGNVIDAMLETVGEDIRDNPQKAEKIFSGDLIGGDNMRMKVIEALNRLDNYHRQVVVLYDIEMLSTDQLSGLLGISIEQTRIDIEVGERAVKTYLENAGVDFDSVAEEINITGRMVNMDVVGTVAETIGQWLESETDD